MDGSETRKSFDTDAESASPETNYFKMMMQDNEMGRVHDGTDTDSILGGQTLASVMNQNQGSESIHRHRNESAYAGDSSSYERDESIEAVLDPQQQQQQQATGGSASDNVPPNPSETLSIVGVEEDDISTIANDTVHEATKAFFTGNGSRNDSKPRIRLFQEYTTPEKKKKPTRAKASGTGNAESGASDDGSGDTAPETPPGMIRVPAGSHRSSRTGDESFSGKSKSRSGSRSKPKSSFFRSRRVYVVAAVLALILLVSIVALSVALSGMRGGETSPGAAAAFAEAESESILDFWPDLDAGTPSGTSATGAGSPTQDDEEPSGTFGDAQEEQEQAGDGAAAPESPPEATTGSPTPLPTASPTTSPTTNPLFGLRFEDLLDLLQVRGGIRNARAVTKAPESIQYEATRWLSEDPAYGSYSEDRLVQRWTLAVLSQSLDGVGDGSPSLAGWKTYTDECTWFSSSTKNNGKKESPCDQQGIYETIDIRDQVLGGTLPTELALLSSSLVHLNLEGNDLVGTIPKEFEDLSFLETLRLRRNNLVGGLNMDFGNIPDLEILDLADNELTGKIPYSIVDVETLTEIYLDFNNLSGDIPWEIGNLEALEKLALSNNNLTGWIPDGLGNMDNLEVLTLGNNNLTGALPKDVCKLKGVDVLVVDCDKQGCECCTECSATEAPTLSPTLPPTGVPTVSPTVHPTSMIVRFTPQPSATEPPTASPTLSPTTKEPTESPTTGEPSASPTACTGNEMKVSKYSWT
uniref:Leucine-rich repeat-containing N-terminal plant-type domain-containing protein n=1 Tax=Pseudo-nitzschia multistriata TaxID=183589 RepID=A0A448ZEA8_9STRA